ncbi:hypothetical protein HYU93_04220 [Candidatus Daviesbacteria bacterium]|nr:hypothetical protein [Candidatus Daviesbacteria bacterium]
MDNPPSPVQVAQGSSSGGNKEDEESLFEAKINNPFSKFFGWIKRLIQSEGINIKIKPLTAIGLVMALTGGGGIIGGVIVYFFPHNSPILHREVMYQGSLQRTEKGFFLTLPNSDLYILRPKVNSSINFQTLQNGQALIKGNLTPENFVIEVSEIILLNPSASLNPTPEVAVPQISLNSPNSPNLPNSSTLPDLYSGLKWETNQKKLLIFTSGKRKIEQEGIYLESAQISAFPQDFINYYLGSLKAQGFKETLNSINPEGITITYAKDNLFLTFGIKNIYKGPGDRKQPSGYKAFIEHN